MQLKSDWFVEGLQDLEYKQYILLGYLQWVRKRFDHSKLYPEFSDLIAHYNNLVKFIESRDKMRERFPQKLSGIDMQQLKLQYESLLSDGEALAEIADLVAYALPRMEARLEEGRELYELIEEAIEIDSVGLLPLNRDEGYFLLHGSGQDEVNAYVYRSTIFEHAKERFRGIHTRFIATFTYSITNTFEAIKLELIRNRRELPNPATFAICSRLNVPETETLVPVAKRKFIRHLANI